ncbi:MAG TPA: hypothetical protein VJZ51_01820 [Bacilli bacterium]|nr:hypothetical protein [Bacilli bacterium]
MKKITITAFEPFGIIPTNSSLEVLKALPEENITKLILPVSYQKCDQAIKSLLLEGQPDFLLLLGQAQNRRVVSLEQIAINLINTPTPDNDGKAYLEASIKDDGADGYFNTIDSTNIINLLAPKHPLSLSYSAGVYVCNYIFYLALYYVKKFNLTTKVGFIHFPLYKNQTNDNSETLPLDTMVAATKDIIDLL